MDGVCFDVIVRGVDAFDETDVENNVGKVVDDTVDETDATAGEVTIVVGRRATPKNKSHKCFGCYWIL